jgi:hypothetical protein
MAPASGNTSPEESINFFELAIQIFSMSLHTYVVLSSTNPNSFLKGNTKNNLEKSSGDTVVFSYDNVDIGVQQPRVLISPKISASHLI